MKSRAARPRDPGEGGERGNHAGVKKEGKGDERRGVSPGFLAIIFVASGRVIQCVLLSLPGKYGF